MYSQNEEEKHILKFFGGKTGTVLDIGANDGKTFSNSLALIEKGWWGILVEPSKIAFEKLEKLHGKNEHVKLLNCAIGGENMKGILHESGSHLPDGSDVALLSSLKKWETEKWTNVKFEEKPVNVLAFREIISAIGDRNLDFITIDAEGMDMDILKQIPLNRTQLLCIEWNSIQKVKDEILNYTALFDLVRIIYQSPENLLIAR